MSWFRTPSNLKPSYTGLQLQTAVATLPIPILWGRTKLAPNVIFYDNFRAVGVKSGKGGLFGAPATGTNYSADLVFALCEGPISGVGSIWRNQSTYELADLGLSLFTGSTPQTVWSYLASAYPAQALAYQGTAYVAAANYQLGGAADVGNHNFEAIGPLAGTGANGIDADPAQVIYDFLVNPQYGAGFDAGAVDLTTLYGAGGDASLQSYCRAMGLAFSPLLSSPEPASSTLTRWLQLLNCAAVWSAGRLKFIPYGDVAVAAGDVARTITTTVPIPAQKSDGSFPAPAVVVSTAGHFVSDGGVTYSVSGAALSFVGAAAPAGKGRYGLAPNGTYLFHRDDQGVSVTIAATLAVSTAYVPNLTPVYRLTDLDFVDSRGNKDPVLASRADPFSLPTVQRIQCLSRNNQYGATPVEARDQSQIETYGLRVGSSLQAHEICDEIGVAPVVAQTILQRALYVRTRFSFKLSFEYCLLDPMDIVTLTDANLGLDGYPVRIVAIEEDDAGLLDVTAEELTVGVSTPGANPASGAVSFQPNQAARAAAINPPLIYEPPPAMTGNVAQVWVGASGGSAGVADPNWGGAFVWASVDNATYSQIGTLTQPLRQGALTAGLASGSGFDTVNALAVSLAMSGGTLSGTSEASARAGATLCLIEGELLAYESATLTGTNAYSLTGLQRGFAGSAASAHPAGAAFVRLDSAVGRYDLPANWVGVPLYFKFQSFNVFGGGVQDLSACAAYPYQPSGASSLGPATQALAVGAALDFGLVSAAASESDDWGTAGSAPAAVIDLGAVAS